MHRNVQNVLVVIGVGEEDSGAWMLQASAILKKKMTALALLVIWNTLFKGGIR